MIDEEQPRVPVPVVAAALIFPLATAIQSVQILTSNSSKLSELKTGLFALGLFALSLALAYGLWRRVWRTRMTVLVFAVFGIAYAVMGTFGSGALSVVKILGYATVIGLLLVPASAREWFPNGA